MSTDRVGNVFARVQIGGAEGEVVLEEVDVSEHVTHHELLVRQAVAFQQVGVRGVVVDHHLVDLGQAILVALAEPLVLHAEAPMRITIGKATVGGDLVHVVVAEHLEHDRKEVETMPARDLFDLVLLVPQIARQRGVGGKLRHGYFPLPKNSLMLPTTASRSRISLVMTRSSLEKCSRKSFTN